MSFALAALVVLGTGHSSQAQVPKSKQKLGKPIVGEFTSRSPKYNNCYYQRTGHVLYAGATYVFEMASNSFNPQILLRSSGRIYYSRVGRGKKVAQLQFTPKITTNCDILLSTKEPGKTGKFAYQAYIYKVIAQNPGKPPETSVRIVPGKVSAWAKQAVSEMQAVAKRDGPIVLGKVNAFKNSVLQYITIDKPTFDSHGNVQGTIKFGSKVDTPILLHQLPLYGRRAFGKWALAIRVPQVSLSSTLGVSGSLKLVLDQFEISSPVFVFATEEHSIRYHELSPRAQSFYSTIYKTKEFSVRLAKGFNLLTAARFKPGSAMDRVVKKFGINITEVQLEGVVLADYDLKALNDARKEGKLKGALKEGTRLRATLSDIQISKLPKGWISASPYIEVTGTPSVGFGCNLIMPTKGGGYRTFTAKMRLAGVGPEVEGSIYAEGVGDWKDAFGINGLHLYAVGLQISLNPQLDLGLGMRAELKVGQVDIDVAGKFKVNLTTGIPTDAIFRIGSEKKPLTIGARDLATLCNTLIKAAKPSAPTLDVNKVPNIILKDFVGSYAPKGGDVDLKIPAGIVLRGKLLYGKTELASVDGEVNTLGKIPSVKLKGQIRDVDLKGLKLKGASCDILLTPSLDAHFNIKGKLQLLLVTHDIDIKMKKGEVRASIKYKLNGLYQTETLLYSTLGLKQWIVIGTIQNDLITTLEKDMVNAAKSWRNGVKRQIANAKQELEKQKQKAADYAEQIKSLNAKLIQGGYQAVKKRLDDANRKLYLAQVELNKLLRDYEKTNTKLKYLKLTVDEKAKLLLEKNAKKLAYEAATKALSIPKTTVNQANKAMKKFADTLNTLNRVLPLKEAAENALSLAQKSLTAVEEVNSGATQAVEYIGKNVNNFFTIKKMSFLGNFHALPLNSLNPSSVSLAIEYRWLGKDAKTHIRISPTDIKPSELLRIMKAKLGIS